MEDFQKPQEDGPTSRRPGGSGGEGSGNAARAARNRNRDTANKELSARVGAIEDVVMEDPVGAGLRDDTDPCRNYPPFTVLMGMLACGASDAAMSQSLARNLSSQDA